MVRLFRRRPVESAFGYTVGDLLTISADIVEVRVARVTKSTVSVEWPWWTVDPDSRNSWDGTMGFPRDPDHYDWRNYPWRMEPEGWHLAPGDRCLIAIPDTTVRLEGIENYDPPADFGSLPRPAWAFGLRPLQYEEGEDSGYTLSLDDAGKPIDTEIILHAGTPE